MKKILLVSNNPLSQIRNNGKTLYSFFQEYPQEMLGQIYVENTYPDFESKIMFYRITDKENLKSIFDKDVKCGNKVGPKVESHSTSSIGKNNRWKDGNIARLVREFVWMKKSWKNESFDLWLDDFKPDIVFLYAGDSIFTYDIAKYVVDRFNCKLGIYISDDYILPRSTCSIFDVLRRRWIRSVMGKTIRCSDYFFTISEDMRILYKDIFEKDSVCVMNIPRSAVKEYVDTDRDQIEFIYCGGLEYGREESLVLLADTINRYNKRTTGKKGFLSIYSLEAPSKEVLSKLNISGAAAFKGALNKKQVESAIDGSDIVVHVESFEKKNMESTRLSISTKISEYLCCGKAILAIGPEKIASMNYVSSVACCVTSKNVLENAIEKLIVEEDYRRELVEKSKSYYLKINEKMYPSLVIDKLNDK